MNEKNSQKNITSKEDVLKQYKEISKLINEIVEKTKTNSSETNAISNSKDNLSNHSK